MSYPEPNTSVSCTVCGHVAAHLEGSRIEGRHPSRRCTGCGFCRSLSAEGARWNERQMAHIIKVDLDVDYGDDEAHAATIASLLSDPRNYCGDDVEVLLAMCEGPEELHALRAALGA